MLWVEYWTVCSGTWCTDIMSHRCSVRFFIWTTWVPVKGVSVRRRPAPERRPDDFTRGLSAIRVLGGLPLLPSTTVYLYMFLPVACHQLKAATLKEIVWSNSLVKNMHISSCYVCFCCYIWFLLLLLYILMCCFGLNAVGPDWLDFS